MEAANVPHQPIEPAGMTSDIIQKLKDKATVLTQERKRRGREIPEGLMSQEHLRNFKTTSSQTVSKPYVIIEGVNVVVFIELVFQLPFFSCRVCIVLAFPAYYRWTFNSAIPARY